jgi:hypothetical protein
MGGRNKIPEAFKAKLEEKRKQTRINFEEDFREDFVAFESDGSAGESATVKVSSTTVEYTANLAGGTVLPIRGIEVQFPFKPCKISLRPIKHT